MKTQTFHAPAISCERCSTAIRKALLSRSGIERVEVDIPDRRITVEFDDRNIRRQAIEDILASEGYPVGPKTMARGVRGFSICCGGSCHMG